MVLLSGRNIKTVRESKKLEHKFLGPFQVEKCIGKQAYQFKLPSKYRRIHNVLHISLLEKYQRNTSEEPKTVQPDLESSLKNMKWTKCWLDGLGGEGMNG
jgi:hypothetical protein